MDHDNDYQEATIQFNVSYQRVYSWVRKYHEAADSWEALKDNRGHRKPQKALEEMTEKERLEAEIKRLKKINREMELEIAFAKKLVEIRNRRVKRPDDIKRFIDGSLKMYENGNLKLYIFVHFFVYSLKKLEVMYT